MWPNKIVFLNKGKPLHLSYKAITKAFGFFKLAVTNIIIIVVTRVSVSLQTKQNSL